VRRPEGVWVVMVGSSLEPSLAALARVRAGLVLGGAVLVLLGGLGAWLLAGAALRPVERLWREAAELHHRDPAGRLAVPGTRDEVAALARTFNDLLTRLQATLRQQRRLVADAGHELRSPLAFLRAELELAGRAGRSRAELADAATEAATPPTVTVRAVGASKPRTRSHGGGLPGAVEPQEPGQPAGQHPEGQPVDRHDRPVALGQAARLDRHPGPGHARRGVQNCSTICCDDRRARPGRPAATAAYPRASAFGES
jgi:signal transduction histidine kinase